MSTSTTDSRPERTQARPPKTIPAPVPVLPMPPDDEPDPRDLGGLLALVDGAERPLPLRSVRVRAHIEGDVCRTTVRQVFANPFEADSGTLLEAVHIFPLPSEGAVTEMQLLAGDLRVRAECREREAAEQAFAEAREKGQRAGLLTAERADVHTLRVTNLPPGEEIHVEFVLLERLEHRDGERRWRFPTVVAPRYLPGEASGHEGPGVLPDTDRAPDASRLQPPLRLSGGTPLDLEVHVASPVSGLSSSLHAVRLELEDGDARIAPSTEATLDRDFVLAIGGGMGAGGDDDASPSAQAWTDGTHTLLYVEPPSDVEAPALPRDAVFVLDRSGSMSGRKMEAARLAMRTALRGLAPGDRFHLMAFDNQLEVFGNGLVDYDEASLAAAEGWLAGIGARGGTEMRAAMRAALQGETPDGRLRTVLLITDGQVWNQAELLRSVSRRAPNTLVFTMGIDTAVNEDLLRRMARLGGGTCELLTPREDIEAAVARLEARFGSPVASELRVAGGPDADGPNEGKEDSGVTAKDGMDLAWTPARDKPPTIFHGAPASLLLAGAPADGRIEVRMQTPEGPRTVEAIVRDLDVPLGALWARERVAALEDRWALEAEARPEIEAEIRETALAHGIASRFTAFVAVIETTSAEGERVEIVQPVELPAQWDEGFRGAVAQPPAADAPGTMRSALHGGAPGMRAASLRGFLSDSDAGAGLDQLGLGGSGHQWKARKAPGRERETGKAGPRPASSRRARTPRHGDHPSGHTTEPDPAGELARKQRADGSFGGDVAKTAAALLRLVELGHTRRKGLRRRVVAKAARWLREHGGEAAVAREALAALRAAEATGGAG